jgi:DnaK suppressor protein
MSNNSGLSVNNTESLLFSTQVALAPNKKNSRKERVQRFKHALLQARSVILAELSPAGSALTHSIADVSADILDRSASDLERTLCLLLRERGRNKLKAIDEALERIQDGTFGFCEDCGEKIPLGRLEVMPFATLCRDCKTLHERREKLFSSDREAAFSYD